MFPNLHINVLFQAEGCAPIVAEVQIHHEEVQIVAQQEHKLYEVKRAKTIAELRHSLVVLSKSGGEETATVARKDDKDAELAALRWAAAANAPVTVEIVGATGTYDDDINGVFDLKELCDEKTPIYERREPTASSCNWLFLAKNKKWQLGTKRAKNKREPRGDAQATKAVPNDGVLPHEIDCAWYVNNDDRLEKQRSVSIVACQTTARRSSRDDVKDELMLKVDALGSEIEEKDAENRRLRSEIERLRSEQRQSISSVPTTSTRGPRQGWDSAIDAAKKNNGGGGCTIS